MIVADHSRLLIERQSARILQVHSAGFENLSREVVDKDALEVHRNAYWSVHISYLHQRACPLLQACSLLCGRESDMEVGKLFSDVPRRCLTCCC